MAEILPAWLEKLSAQGGCILLFDAVNQLATTRDRELWWWPEKWPSNIRVVFSTLPGDSLREMASRGWTGEEFVVRIPLLAPDEKSAIMEGYLKLFSRALEPKLLDKVLAAPQTANPLFLRTVLVELRLRSRYENLGADLHSMLACPDPAALFVHVLKNLEQDFPPHDHPGLVHRALGLMGAALRGLSENELLQLLSPGAKPASEPLPRHYWAPLYLALEESLVSREGQLSFFHDYLRQAVWREYLDEAEEREAAHGRLAETVIRWSEPDAFGASLKTYGFKNGIRHLLAIERNEELTNLLLDKIYREIAASTLHDPQPILEDVARVRQANALAGQSDLTKAADLTVLALTGREQLIVHLREVLDKAASESDWESVISLAAAGDSASMRLLLALRALSRENTKLTEKAISELRTILSRWASESGKPEFSEIVTRLSEITESKIYMEECK
jgi:hypothetical protein